MTGVAGASLAEEDFTRLMAPNSVVAWLRAEGIIDASAAATTTVLGGGVSSVITEVDSGGDQVIVKQPRHRLAVEREWLADPARAAIEAAALDYVAAILPHNSPRLIAFDARRNAVVMSAAGTSVNWKEKLLAGAVDGDAAEAVGRFAGQLHAASATDSRCQDLFDSRATFRELRIDPFYGALLKVYPKLRAVIRPMLDRMLGTRRALVHGDFTPKNILILAEGIWVLDWEIAHFGDPMFDLASMLAHLWLKAVHLPNATEQFEVAIQRLVSGYVQFGRIDDPRYLTQQAAMFMLARVDGTSPAEYLRPSDRERVRQLAFAALYNEDVTVYNFGGWLMSTRSDV